MIFLVPKIVEQKKIAEILCAIDDNISGLQRFSAQVRTQKAALMQQLLTGKRRVKVDDDDLNIANRERIPANPAREGGDIYGA